jgi:hypothetical protein
MTSMAIAMRVDGKAVVPCSVLGCPRSGGRIRLNLIRNLVLTSKNNSIECFTIANKYHGV